MATKKAKTEQRENRMRRRVRVRTEDPPLELIFLGPLADDQREIARISAEIEAEQDGGKLGALFDQVGAVARGLLCGVEEIDGDARTPIEEWEDLADGSGWFVGLSAQTIGNILFFRRPEGIRLAGDGGSR